MKPVAEKTEILYSPMPFRIPIKARALCADGKVRMFRVGQPDTFFSIPAWGKVKGLAVRGFVSMSDTGEVEFTALPNRHFSKLPDAFQRPHLEAKAEMGDK